MTAYEQRLLELVSQIERATALDGLNSKRFGVRDEAYRLGFEDAQVGARALARGVRELLTQRNMYLHNYFSVKGFDREQIEIVRNDSDVEVIAKLKGPL